MGYFTHAIFAMIVVLMVIAGGSLVIERAPAGVHDEE
jgi:hypothetical protein